MEQMVNTVSFPGMGLEFEINRVAFKLGNFPVYWYGILIAMGFVLAIIYTNRRAKSFGVDPDRMLDVIIGGAIGGIVGARAYFVLLKWDYYGQNLDQIFNTRSGGMAIYGGLIGGVLIGILLCKIRKVKILPTLDLAVGGFFIGQAIGRWGNFVNVEAFGANTSLPWGMTSPRIVEYLSAHEQELEAIGMNIDPNMPVHPTFLYESLWCFAGFLLIAFYTKHRKFDGELTLIYMMWYGVGRGVIEGLRTDSLMIPNTSLRASQVLAIAMAIAAAVAWWVITSKVKQTGKHLFVDSEEGQLIVKGEFYKKKDKAAPANELNVQEPAKETNQQEPTPISSAEEQPQEISSNEEEAAQTEETPISSQEEQPEESVPAQEQPEQPNEEPTSSQKD